MEDYHGEKQDILNNIYFIIQEATEMIFKEENILFPMALSTLTEDEWIKIAAESEEIGYCLIKPVEKWIPKRVSMQETSALDKIESGLIQFETGILSVKQLELMLNHLPVDITFIDKDDVVRYFSHGKERIFARTKAVIGRTVQNCHPPKSVHIVEKLLNDFKSGKKIVKTFGLNSKINMYIYGTLL